MDRFIGYMITYVLFASRVLKSNMDRFIVNTFAAYFDSFMFLKSNMDRFIAVSASCFLKFPSF